MKKLIAKRPIQYLGRTYEPGDALPAHDGRMVEAWTRAGTAVWVDTAAATAEQDAGLENEGWKVINALLDMGVILEDENGAYVGKESLEKQILIAPCAAMEAVEALQAMGVNIYDTAGNFVGATAIEEQIMAMGRESVERYAEDQGARETDMVTGHMDAKELERMTKADLLDLAGKLGVDLSGAKNNAERAALIAAVEVRAPAQENGGVQ